MPRRALQYPFHTDAHLLLWGDDELHGQARRQRTNALWKLSKVTLTRPQSYARSLKKQGRTAREIMATIADLPALAADAGLRLTKREKDQVAYIAWALKNDPKNGHRRLLQWFAKGRLKSGRETQT